MSITKKQFFGMTWKGLPHEKRIKGICSQGHEWTCGLYKNKLLWLQNFIIFLRNIHMNKKRACYLKNVSVLTFRNTIMLRSIRT